MTTPIEVLAVRVNWLDGYMNDPSVALMLNRMPALDRYDKRPCASDALSTEQEAIIGRGLDLAVTPGWHIYLASDGDFAWFFTWGGEPDDGFGGWRRTVTLTDGTEEEIVGGWHVTPKVASAAGFGDYVDVGLCEEPDRGAGGRWPVCVARFVTVERLAAELDCHVPGAELRDGSIAWRGQPSKAEFMAAEQARRVAVCDAHGGNDEDWSKRMNWYDRLTDDERREYEWRPYSALGPA